MGVGEMPLTPSRGADGEVDMGPGCRCVRPALSRRRCMVSASNRRSSVTTWRSRRSASYEEK